MRRISRLGWWGLFFFGSGLALLASFYFDAAAQIWIVHHQNPDLRNFMHYVSRIGDWPAHMIAGLMLLVLAYWRGRKKWVQILAAMILAFILAGTATRAVKISTGRARPDVQTDVGWHGPRFTSRYNAFPSGHTATSTAFFATLALANWRIGSALLFIPLLIAFSRMYLSAHHLSDVVGAILIGLVTAYLISRWIPETIRNPKSEIRN